MRSLGKRICVAFLAVLVLATVAHSVAMACPGCKEALASSEGGQGDLISGYFWSILFMMSMPFMLLGTFGGSMYLAVRRARARDAAGADSHSQQSLPTRDDR